MIKLKTLQCGHEPGLFYRPNGHHKGFYKREAGGRESEKQGDVTTEAEVGMSQGVQAAFREGTEMNFLLEPPERM